MDWIRAAASARRRRRGALRRLLPQLCAGGRRSNHSRDGRTGQVTSMLCFSPDFTHADPSRAGAAGRAAEGRDRFHGPARRAPLPDAERSALSWADACGRRAADGRRNPPFARYAEQPRGRFCASRTTTRTGPGGTRNSHRLRTCSSKSSIGSIRLRSACNTIRRTRPSAATIRSRSSSG